MIRPYRPSQRAPLARYPSSAATVGGVLAMTATAITWLIALGPTDGAQSVAGMCIYVPPGSNGPGSEKPSIDSTFA
jgi:hypothetical protein